MTIQINISGTTIYNVTNDVIIDSIELGKRADYSFEVGSFKMFTSQITKNIPPYSFCRITDDYVSTDYLISSEATAYFTNGKWMHDCKLLSLEAIMECYILGAKTFSLADSPNDRQVLVKALALINQQYGIGKFRITNTIDTFLQSYSNEYTFPDGTSLYEVVKSIANKNNLRFELNLNSFGYGESSYFYVHFENNTSTDYTLVEPKLVSFKLMQEANDYCKYLQCASADVVDRANPTTFRNLTVRATNGVVVSEDTAEVVLPTKVEGITKLSIRTDVNFYHLRIYNNGNSSVSTIFSLAYINACNPYHDSLGGYTQTESHTLNDWCYNYAPSDYSSTSKTLWQIIASYFDLTAYSNNLFVVKKYDNSDNVYIGMVADPHGANLDTEEDLYGAEFNRMLDVTSYVAEDSYFNSLDESDRPKYIVYKSGDNKITNLNASYKRDFWNILFNNTVYGFFETSKQYDEYSNNLHLDVAWSYSEGKETPFNARFNVECVPITNPLLIDTKNTTPINETSFKAMTRTYQMGDSNGLLVDFKALSNDIDKQNDTLGDVEAILELDADVYYDDEGNDELYYPEPNHQITFDYKNTSYTFYISSMATRYTNNRKTYQLNLSRTPYKIADAIGVDYQFNPTWLPLDNIIERSLFYEINYDNFKSAYIDKANFFLKIQINSVGTFYLRPVIMKNNGYYVAYCEVLDNIVIGMSTDVVSSTKKSINNVKYVDDNGAFHEMSMWFVADDNTLTLAESFKLPLIENHNFSNSIIIANSKQVYKDSREKLTFTIKVNDSYI